MEDTKKKKSSKYLLNATYSSFVSVDRSSVGSKHGPILSQEVSSLRPYTLKFISKLNRVQVVHCCFGKVGLP